MTGPESDDEDEPPALEPGKLELLEGEHESHGAGWLYVPDLSSMTGMASHRVPAMAPERPQRRLGFGHTR
jgi:hypothetical protein